MTSSEQGRDFRERFDDGLVERINRVYQDASGQLPGHRAAHPWVTGYLGDVFAPVWFVAENPSLTQVEKVAEPHVEHQWAISRGDELFRDMLFKHGFKGGTAYSHGDWRCYITDVIKSTDLVKEHNDKPGASRNASAKAWAPVLSWELTCGRPRIIVTVGARAHDMLSRLIEAKAIPDPQCWGAQRVSIPHYVYVMSRPDNVRKLPAGHPDRVKEYDQAFARIAAARDALPVVLRVGDGSEHEIGTPGEVAQAERAIFKMTGGSSGAGRWSYLYGDVFYGPSPAILEPERVGRISSEAADFVKAAGSDLPDAAGLALTRLAEMPRPSPRSQTTIETTTPTWTSTG